MALRITCPFCKDKTKLVEPYPQPGSIVNCKSCVQLLSISFPAGLVERLESRGVKFQPKGAGGNRYRLEEWYKMLKKRAVYLGVFCPKYQHPFVEADLEALDERLDFIYHWHEKTKVVRLQTLPWERPKLPTLPIEPTPEMVMHYVDESKPFIQRGRWWYWVMTPIRYLMSSKSKVKNHYLEVLSKREKS